MSVKTAIQCDAVILRCVLVPDHVCGAAPGTDRPCPECGSRMAAVSRCQAGFALATSGHLIRCVAENKDGWRCEDGGGRDYCAAHAYLADPSRVEQPTPRALNDP